MISSTVWNANLLSQMAIIGFVGSKLPDFTNAIATGCTSNIVGSAFVTADTGTLGVGGGVGSGVGLVVSSTLISSNIYSSLLSKGFEGTQLLPMCQAIGIACSTTLLSATFTSTHSQIISGVGTVIPLTIAISESVMGDLIENGAIDFTGDKWIDLAESVAEGLVNAIILTGVASVTITPNPGSTPLPTPPIGTETGIGVIT